MEILAPAGSIAALKAAIKAGANAVYLGLGEYNARIKSNDFTIQNLPDWVSYAHLFGVKVYVTLNTAVKDEEMDRVISLAEGTAHAGADALIVADLGLASVLSKITDIPLHLSTQAGVQNSLDVCALKKLGIKRVILSRETPLSDLPAIKKLADEVEIFVQGAMCVSFSGGCLLGSRIYGASGNRGVCNQGCRLTYTAYDESGRELKKGKLLSPFDLSRGAEVLKLESLGVDSIKIEGRLKRPIYVYSATKYYRDLLDGKEENAAYRDLEESFNRGFTKGYTLNKSAKIINPITSSHIGVPVGQVVKVTDRKGYKFAEVRAEYEFTKGDGAKILRKGVEVGGSDVTSVKRIGGIQEIPVSDGVKAGDTVCLTTNARKERWADQVDNTIPVDFRIEGKVGEVLTLTASAGGSEASVQAESVLERSKSADNSVVLQKLSKLGGSDFSLGIISDLTEEPIFLPVTELVAMRRKALALLKEKIVASHTPTYRFERYVPAAVMAAIGKEKKIFEVERIDAAEQYAEADAFVLCPPLANSETLRASILLAGGRPCYLRLPKIAREGEIAYLEAILKENPTLGVYADNLYAVQIARSLGRTYIAGFGLNIFNKETANLFADADYRCASVEHPEAGDLVFAGGKVRLMSFAHCPFSVVYGKGCEWCMEKDKLYYRTNDHRYLILRRKYASCDFTMYEDELSFEPRRAGKSAYYRFVGANEEERKTINEYCGGTR